MQYLITHFSDFQLASLGSFLLHESVFFLAGLPFIYLERAGLLSKYKIQVNSIFFAAIVINCYYFVNIKFGRGEGGGVSDEKLVSFVIHVSMQTKNNSPAAQEKCITRLILYHLSVNLPLMIVSYPVFRFMGMKSSLPLPSRYFQVLYMLELFFLHFYPIQT